MASATYEYTFQHKHLLGIEGLHPLDLTHLLDLAETYANYTRKDQRPEQVLKNKTVVNLFLPPNALARMW